MAITLSLSIPWYEMRNICLVIKCIKTICVSYVGRSHLWMSSSPIIILKQSCKLFTVILTRVFMRAGFVIPLLVSYPAINISYLSLPNCSGNFNRFIALQVLCKTLHFGHRFWASLRCTCATASSSSIQSSTSIKILSAIAASVYLADHRLLLRVCLLSRK